MSTFQVYKNINVTISTSNDYHCVIANEDIKSGTLILLEHVIWNKDENYILSFLIKDKVLYDSLYPRNIDDSELNEIYNTLPNKNEINFEDLKLSYSIKQKFNANVFNFDNVFVLGNSISKFNHDCIPNCHIDIACHVNTYKFYGFWAHRNIKKGQELTIDYINTESIDRHNCMKKQLNFKCNCTDEFIKLNKKRAEIHKNMGSYFRDNDQSIIDNLVDKYLESYDGIKVVKTIKQIKNELKNIIFVN